MKSLRAGLKRHNTGAVSMGRLARPAVAGRSSPPHGAARTSWIGGFCRIVRAIGVVPIVTAREGGTRDGDRSVRPERSVTRRRDWATVDYEEVPI